MTHPEAVDRFDIEQRKIDIERRRTELDVRVREAGGADVGVLAVSKGQPLEAVIAAVELDMLSLGENYAQELNVKATEVDAAQKAKVDWHFIGQLQTNKVRLIADHVAVWQSVDRLKVGREIAKRSPGATVFAQVNLSEESQKAGCSFDEVDQLLDDLRSLDLVVAGLMGVGTAADAVETARGFARLRAAVDRQGLAECSMGMSADLELAIAEGSTMVRVGSDLFGPRS